MARRRGVLLSFLILLVFSVAGGVVFYWTLPFWISKVLHRPLIYSGYSLRPFWTLRFEQIAADSLFSAREVEVRFTLRELLLGRQIRSFRAESLTVWSPPPTSEDTIQRPPVEPAFGYPLFPLWIEHLEVKAFVQMKGGQKWVQIQGLQSQLLPGVGFWRWQGEIENLQWSGTPGHRLAWSGFVYPDAVYLPVFRIEGSKIRGVGEWIGAEHRIQFHWDTLAVAGIGEAVQLRASWNYSEQSGRLEASSVAFRDRVLKDLFLAFRWTPDSLDIEELDFQFQGLSIRSRGWVHPRTRRYGGTGVIRGQYGEWQLKEARLTFQGDATGFRGHIWVNQGQFRTQEIRGLQAEVSANWNRNQWRIQNLRAEVPKLRGSLTSIQGEFLALLEASGMNASVWVPEAQGQIDMRMAVGGRQDSVEVRGTLSGDSLVVPEGYLQGFTFQISGPFRALEVTGQAKQMAIRGQVFHNVWATFLRSNGMWHFRIGGQSAWGPNLKVAGTWKISPGTFSIKGDTLELEYPQTGAFFVGSFTLSQEKGRVFFVGEGQDHTGGHLQILASVDSMLAVSVQVESLHLKSFPLPSRVGGVVDLTLQAQGDVHTPELLLKGRWYGQNLVGLQIDSVDFRIHYHEDTLKIQWLRLVGPDREARVEGFWQLAWEELRDRARLLQAPVNLHLVTWRWPATDLLNRLTSDLYFENARITVDATLQGSLENPKVFGKVTQDAETVVLVPSGTVLKKWRLEGTAEGHVFRIREIYGSTNGGSVQGTGQIVFYRTQADTVSLSLQLERFPLRPSPEIEAEVTGLIRVSGPFPAVFVEGDLKIDQGYLSVPFGKSRVPSQPEAPSPIRYRITLESPGRLYFINDVVQAELKADLVITKDQEVGKSISGTLEILNGTFLYLDRSFTITEGRMIFNQDVELNPQIQFHAENLVQDSILVTLVATGTLQSPEVNLMSDPPLALEDIVSLLSFGRTLSQLSPSLTSLEYIRERSLNLAEALVSRELKQKLRLTELEIATGLAGRDPHFTVGFYLSPKVHIRYTHDILSPTKDIFLLNYALTSRLGLYIERDRDGRLGGGLNFRVRF